MPALGFSVAPAFLFLGEFWCVVLGTASESAGADCELGSAPAGVAPAGIGFCSCGVVVGHFSVSSSSVGCWWSSRVCRGGWVKAVSR